MKNGVLFYFRKAFGRGPVSTAPLAVDSGFPPPALPWRASYPPGVEWGVSIPGRSLHDLFDDAVAGFADRPCIDFLGKRYKYRDIADLIERAAKGLQSCGVGRDVRVGLLLPNCPYFVVSYYAVLKAGGTVVNCNPLYAQRQLVSQINASQTEILITLDNAALYAKAASALPLTGLRRLIVCSTADMLRFPESAFYPVIRRKERIAIRDDSRHLPFARLIDNDGRYEAVAISPQEDIAALQYTGGTTGTAMGAMLTHANLSINTEQILRWFPQIVAGGERVLAVLPFCHVFGMTGVMNAGIAAGAELIVLPRFDIKLVLRTLHRRKPTLMAGVPTMFAAINAQPHLDRYDLSSLKICLSGGAPLPLSVKHRFEALTGCRLVEAYGLTEAAPAVTCASPDSRGKEGSVGLPLPGTTVEVVVLDDPGRPVPLGTVGEICVRGPQVMAGYWRRPLETGTALAGDRLHTGDVGYMDEEGYVFLTDRIKDLILVGGYNVYPWYVEEAIVMHPSVEDACVHGIPDELRGQVVKAFVKLRPGRTLTVAELRDFLRDKLAVHEVPRRIEFRDELPKMPVGKPCRRALVEQEDASEEIAAKISP